VVLLGAGETSPAGGAVFEELLRRHPAGSPPKIVVIGTPAGFEPNADRVAGRIADFLAKRLAPFRPSVSVLPARGREAPSGTEDGAAAEEVLRSDMVFLGPGSPTYAVRQLRGSRLWHAVAARHLLGGITVLASAAMVAAGREALPVYEIFKVGEGLHWKEGLDLLGAHGLSLVLVPHWNNRDGGTELDTRRCYLGEERFGALLRLLPAGRTVVGVDEGTALFVDPSARSCSVSGAGTVTVLGGGETRVHPAKASFPIDDLGPFRPPSGGAGIPPDRWDEARSLRPRPLPSDPEPHRPMDAESKRLLAERDEARRRKDWLRADELRERLLAAGWRVTDTPAGQVAEPIPS
jgi:hypothetical protein